VGGAAFARAAGSIEMCGGWCSVAWTVHSSATRRAAATRFAGSEGQSKEMAMSPTRCGSSANFHRTSIVRSSRPSFA
jgi:hypothetical protein